MKKSFLFFLCVLFCFSLFAQNGKIVSQRTSEKNLTSLIFNYYNSLETQPTKKNAKVIIDSMVPYFEQVKSSSKEPLKDAYYALLIDSFFIVEDWKNIQTYYLLMQNPDDYYTYIYTQSLYQELMYSKLEKFLFTYTQKNQNDTKFLILHANVLAKQANFLQAKLIYEKLYIQNVLKNEDLFDYAIVLYNLNEYKDSLNIAKNTKTLETQYLLGINYVNLDEYKEAINALQKYNQTANKNSSFYELSLFYQGYCAYKLNNYKEAFNLLDSYSQISTDIPLTRQAYELAARSCLMLQDFKNASKQAEKLINVCFVTEEKQKAVIFCAEIYKDSNEWEKAINLLKPYSLDKTDFGVTCLLILAQIYEKSNQINKAYDVYDQIINEHSSKTKKENAIQNRAKLCYSQKDYKQASKFFYMYVLNYNKTYLFYEEALYLLGECYYKSKDWSQCINFSNKLLNDFPTSVYFYGATKNLFFSYYENQNYTKAKETAQILIQKFNKQAKQDNIDYYLEIILSLSQGESKKIAETKLLFQKNGEYKTLEGRNYAYGLFNLYKEDGNNKEALLIAKNIYNYEQSLQLQEYINFAKIVEYISQNSENTKKPDLLIKAAGYYKKANDQKGAATCLYNAVEVFVELKKTGDAKETANTLKKLYPSSRQAQNVEFLLQ